MLLAGLKTRTCAPDNPTESPWRVWLLNYFLNGRQPPALHSPVTNNLSFGFALSQLSSLPSSGGRESYGCCWEDESRGESRSKEATLRGTSGSLRPPHASPGDSGRGHAPGHTAAPPANGELDQWACSDRLRLLSIKLLKNMTLPHVPFPGEPGEVSRSGGGSASVILWVPECLGSQHAPRQF